MNDSSVPEFPRFRYLTDGEETRAALDGWHFFEIIGLDTETFHDTQRNHSQVSLIQLAPPDGTEVLIIDALAVGVEPVRALVESPAVKMAAHNARFDEGVLQRAGLRPSSFVDTLRLSREALRLPSHSLRAVVAHLFGASRSIKAFKDRIGADARSYRRNSIMRQWTHTLLCASTKNLSAGSPNKIVGTTRCAAPHSLPLI